MSQLPDFQLPEGWEFTSLNPRQTREMFRGALTLETKDPPFLDVLQRAQVLQMGKPISSQTRRRGWMRPGPGPIPGKSRMPSIDDMTRVIFVGLIQLAKEAIHFQQMYSFHSNSSGGDGIDFATAMEKLATIEKDVGVSKKTMRNIWTPTHQLGVPAVLIKLTSQSMPFAFISYLIAQETNGIALFALLRN